MNGPLVSVVMITYNHAPYIGRAIEGVLQQKTDFPFELVIGEDHSTDDTREIVFDYQRQYPGIIRVVTSEHNVGARSNGRRTLEACLGKYIAFCEGDDYWHRPDKLQHQVAYMEAHPDCALVYSDHDRYYVATGKSERSRNRTQQVAQPQDPDISTVLFDPRCRIATCTVMARKALMDRVAEADPVLYQSARFLMGDTPRWAELSLLGKIGYIDDSLATRNVLLESAVHSRDPRRVLRFGKSGCELILYLIDKHDLSQEQRARFQRRWCKCALKLALYEGDAALAEEVRQQVGRLSPADWVRYWGARSQPLHMILAPTVRLLGQFRRLLCPRVQP